MNLVPTEIHEDVLEESICKTLSLTAVNVIPEDLHACHCMKRPVRMIVKFKCHQQKQSSMYKGKNIVFKSQELMNLNFWEDLLLPRVCPMKTSILFYLSANL